MFIYSFAQNVWRFSTEFVEIGAVQKYVNLVDLEKCCKMNTYLVATIGFDDADNEPLKVWTLKVILFILFHPLLKYKISG